MKTVILSLLCLLCAATSATAHPPWAIAVDANNQIYLSDLETIWKIDAAGKTSVFRSAVSGRHTHEITLDRDGNLLGEDLNYEPATQRFVASLWKITPRGDFSYTLAPTAAPPKAVSIWKNKSGASFYFGQTDDRNRQPFLLKRNANGAISVLLGDKQNALRERQIVLYSLAGMTFGRDGETLFVTDRSSVWKVEPDDKFSILYEPTDKKSAVTFGGIAADADDNVLLTDFANRKILKIADGKLSVHTEIEPAWSPSGIYHRSGNLYVLEIKNQPPGANPIVRVQKIAPDGKISTLTTIGDNQSNADQNQSPKDNVKSCASIGLLIAACLILGNQNDTKNRN